MSSWNLFKKNNSDDLKGEDQMSEEVTIDFGETLDISFAAKLHTQLKDEVQNNSVVNFITSGLTRIDASCLQVLASFMIYAKENEIKVHWNKPGEVISQACRLTGLTEVLELNN